MAAGPKSKTGGPMDRPSACEDENEALQLPLDFLDFEALDLIADLKVVIADKAHAALGAGTHFRYFVLEAFQR